MTKTTTTAKKTKSKRAPADKPGKPRKFVGVRKGIDGLLKKEGVSLMTKAISQPGECHLPALKYLFEVTGLYPVTDEDAAPEEDSLAKTLLLRLGVPEEPVVEGSGTKDSPEEATAPGADAVKSKAAAGDE